jgi:hypothetical protein
MEVLHEATCDDNCFGSAPVDEELPPEETIPTETTEEPVEKEEVPEQ